MKHIGLDTSVVVRLLTGEPGSLAELARSKIAYELSKGREFVVSDIVIAESYFALTSAY